MPQAIDLVIKNGATVPVDKTFSLITPAAGDGGVAQWALKEGSISSVFPAITAMAQRTGNKSRQLRVKIKLPSSYSDSVTGLTSVGAAAEANLTISVPDNFPEAQKADFVAYVANSLNTPLLKSMMRDAYPAV